MSRPFTVDDVLAALADGPLDEDDLLDALGDDDGDRLDALLDPELIVELPDGRMASRQALLAGLVCWHRLTADEVSSRRIAPGVDGLVHLGAAPDSSVVLVGDEVVDLVDDVSPAAEAVGAMAFDLPAGWGGELAAGDLVGLVLDGARVRLIGSDDQPRPVTLGEEAAAAAARTLGSILAELAEEHGWPLTLLASSEIPVADRWVLPVEAVVGPLVADHSSVLQALGCPLRDALGASGLTSWGGLVAAPGVTVAQLAVYALGHSIVGRSGDDDGELAEWVGLAWAALVRPDRAPDGSFDKALRVALGQPDVVAALCSHLGRCHQDAVDQVAASVAAVMGEDAAGPGPSWIQAEAAVLRGDAVQARDLLADAARRVPARPGDDWSEAWSDLADLHAIGGQVTEARRLFHLVGSDDVASTLDPWLPVAPTGVGRNQPCPCGSGRKFKQCCLARPPALDLDARASFLWWKLQRRTLQRHFTCLDLPFEALGPAAIDVLIFGFEAHLTAGGVMAEEVEGLASLLPADERALAESWMTVRHRLWRVERIGADGTARVLDVVDGVVRTVPPVRQADPLRRGEHRIGLVLPGPGSWHLVGHPLLVRDAMVDQVASTLAADPDEAELMALVTAVVAAAVSDDPFADDDSFADDAPFGGASSGRRGPGGPVRPALEVVGAGRRAAQGVDTVHRLRVTLDLVEPPVWRRVEVPSTATLGQLHQVLQIAFGWFDGHMHGFEVDRVSYGVDDRMGFGPPVEDEHGVRLVDIAPEGSTFLYTYDFGDSWEHLVEVEAVVGPEGGSGRPRCLGGDRAGPPEDVGGAWGYEELLAALADPAHERHDELTEWVGGPFDPEHFDPDAVDQALARLDLG